LGLIGHGIDIVEISRIRQSMSKPAGEFLVSWFTETEREAEGAPHGHAQYYAGRLAAKEAVVKALGTGFSQGIAWSEVEILRLESGAPSVVLSGTAREVAESLGVTRWLLSISHGDHYAVASAIAVGD
jgi:holo-[acyl-carrier protein] synthase